MKGTSRLVHIFGFPATLVHGDTMVLDRWRWLRDRLPATRNGESLLEVGCGSGAFTIGAAVRGYEALGLSWSESDLAKARERADASGVPSKARFITCDARDLEQQKNLVNSFDVVICCETVEHILDDLKLFNGLYACLKPGGRLLLTAPNLDYKAITPQDEGPFCRTETGWHVRRGYSRGMLVELCEKAGLIPEEISFCSGWVSQRITLILRLLSRVNFPLAWLAVLPLRPMPLVFERPLTWLLGWPSYSICLVAYRPRFSNGISELSHRRRYADSSGQSRV